MPGSSYSGWTVTDDTWYQYDQLDTSRRSTRLVRLQPCSGEDGTVHLSLREVDLEAVSGKYDAMSHTWCSSDNQRKAYINSKPAMLRENIWRFLMH